jgi:hypothetical protein
MSHIVIVETSNEENLVLIEDQTSVSVEIINTEKILASDLPDDIPFSKIKKDGVDGVDYYLNNYFYELDCGSP